MARLGLLVILAYMTFGVVDVMMLAWALHPGVYVLAILMPMALILSQQTKGLRS